MQKKDIAIIAVRLLALYVIVTTVYNLPDYLGVIHLNLLGDDALGRAFFITHTIGAVIKFIIGIALWFYSTFLANLITKDLPESSPSKKEFTLAHVQVVAVSLIGLFILSSAIPDFLAIIISYIFPAANPNYVRSLDIAGNKKVEIPITTLITVALKLGLGFWFLLGANGIVTAIREIWAKGKSI
jgi:hypothetical protein